jgi:hypothetical protein
MEESCSTGQSPQWAVVPVEEEEEYVSTHLKRIEKRLVFMSGTSITKIP